MAFQQDSVELKDEPWEEFDFECFLLARTLVRYRQKLVKMVKDTLFTEQLMEVSDSHECQCIQNSDTDEAKAMVALFIVIRHLESGSDMSFNILLEILRNTAPRTAEILAAKVPRIAQFIFYQMFCTVKEATYAFLTWLSIEDLPSESKQVLKLYKLPDPMAYKTKQSWVKALHQIILNEAEHDCLTFIEVFTTCMKEARPDNFQGKVKLLHQDYVDEIIKVLQKEFDEFNTMHDDFLTQKGNHDRHGNAEAVSQGCGDELKRLIDNIENCKMLGSIYASTYCAILPLLDTERYEMKYGIVFDHEPNPYFALIGCIILELKSGFSGLYHEFLSAMLKIDAFLLSKNIDRCDFALLTLKQNHAHLVKKLDITCIIQSMGPSLNDSELATIDAKKQIFEQSSSLSELIIGRLNDKRLELYDRFMEILAGVDPSTFKLLSGREPTSQEVESCITMEISELKECIKEVGHKTDKKWDVKIDLEKNYVKLRVVEKDQTASSNHMHEIDHPMTYQTTLTKGDIDIEDVMDREECKGKLCVTKGRCGIGKSTMAQHLCRRWASDECLKQFSFLFHINVRQINLFDKQLSLHALLTKNSLYQNRVPLNWLNHWSHLVLIIIDGLDELGHFSDKLHSTRDIRGICEEATPEELLVNVLKRNLLPEATLICTSRPFETLSSLKSDIDLELMGLTQKEVFEYIEKNVHLDAQTRVKSHFKANPILMSICSIISYTSILSRILTREQEVSVCDMETYTRLTAMLVQSYPLRDSAESVQGSPCPESFSVLAEIALCNASEEDNGLKNISIDLEDVICQVQTVDAEIAIKNAEKNGLVHITEVEMDDEIKKILEFSHLSVQEFFAALQFLRMSNTSQDIMEEKLTYLLEAGSLNMYKLFIFGVAMDRDSKSLDDMKKFTIGQKPIADGIRESITKCFGNLVSNIKSVPLNSQLLNLCQIAYEAQSKKLANIILEKCQHMQGILHLKGTPLNALDIKALVFVIGSSNLLEVKLTQTNLDCYSVGILVQSLKANQHLKVLDLSYNQIDQDGLSAINKLLETIKGLEKIGLSGNSITSSSLEKLLPGLGKERKQIALSIAENNIKDEGAKALASALMNTKCLSLLNVSYNNIGIKGMNAMQSLVNQYSLLTRLECDGSAAGDQLIQSLFAESNNTTHLTHLSLNDSLVTNQGADILATNIPKLINLHYIGLRGCQIGTYGAQNITRQVKAKEINVDLQDNQIDVNQIGNTENVLLSGNVQGRERLRRISYAISRGKEFDILDLSNCKIKDCDMTYISEMFQNNGNLEEIELSGNNITEASEKLLTPLVFTCPKLAKINLCHTDINMNSQEMFADMSIRYKKNTVDISYHKINAIGTQCLAGVLRSPSAQLRNLIVNKCDFKQNHLTKISEALQRNRILSKIALKENQIGIAGASVIADLLKGNHYLTTLDLSRNNLNRECGKKIADALVGNSALKIINLNENYIHSEGGMAIATMLKQNGCLTEIHLKKNGLGAEGGKAFSEVLAQNSSLKMIDLENNKIGDEGGKAIGEALAQNSSLTQINLKRNGIGGEGGSAICRALVKNSTLTKIYMGGNNIGAEFGKAIGEALAQNTSLTEIDLSKNGICPEGGKTIGEALEKMSSLTWIDLSFNGIGDEGGKAIGKALAQNSSLTFINLYFNEIGDEGGKAIGEALVQNTCLTKIYLGGNKIGAEFGKAFSGAMAQNSSLTEIRDLFLNGIGPKVGKAICEALAQLSTLATIDLSNNEIGDEGGKAIGKALAQSSFLTQIILNRNLISAEGGKAIGDALAQNSSLIWIELNANGVGDEGAKAIGDALAQNSTLKHIDLRDNGIGAKGGKAISEALATNSSLTQIYLSDNGIGDEGVKAIGEALAQNSSIRRVYLSSNGIGAEGGKAIAKALAQNSSITQMHLSRNRIGDEGAKAIASSLEQNSSLHQIDLRNNGISPRGGKAIGEALAKNASLTELDLTNNRIGDPGGKAIGEALAQNTSLTQILLNVNKIGDEGGKAIGEALAKNSSLTQIYLCNNRIGAEGGKAIGKALAKNLSLTRIYLSDNILEDESAKAISEGLAQNSTLVRIDLDSNRIGYEGAKAFRGTSAHNSSLISINLQNNRIYGESQKAKYKDLAQNQSLSNIIVW